MQQNTLFSKSNLLLLCTIGAIYHTSLSLLRFFFFMIVFDYIDIVFNTIIIVFAVIYALHEHPLFSIEKDVTLLLVMLLYLVISCIARTITTGADWLSINSDYIVDFQYLIIIYFLGKHYASRGIPQILLYLFHAIIVIWSAVILYLLVNVFTNHLIIAPSGVKLCSMDSLHFVLNVNRNHTGAYSGVFLLLSLCMLTWCKKISFRIFHYPAIVINYVLLVLSSSKTALISTLIGFSLIIGLVVYKHFSNTNRKEHLIITALSVFLSGSVFFILRYPTIALYSSIVRDFNGEELAVREIIDSSASTLSGRLPIWKISIRLIFTKRFLFCGVTPRGIFYDIADAMGGENLWLNTHNQLLEVGTTMGFPALIAFFVWAILIFIASVKVYISKKKTLSLLLLPMLLIAFSVMSMAEAYLMFYEHFVAYVFFFICGIIYTKSDLKQKPLFTIDLSKIK